MASAAGDIVVNLGLNRRGFVHGLNEAKGGVSGFVSDVTTGLARVGLAVQGAKTVFNALANAIGAPIKEAAGLEQAEVAFTTLLGSAEASLSMMNDLKAFAKATPFEFTQLRTAATRMMAMGFAADELLPTMRVLGDATSALGGGTELMDRIVVALGQMRAKSIVSAQEMRQLAEAGIPAWEILAEAIGVTVPEAMKLAENRAIDAATAIPALLEGMSSKFGGGMEAQSKTLAGMWSNLKDTIAFALADIGVALDDAFDFKDATSRLMGLVEVVKIEVIPIIQAVVGFLKNWWRSIVAVTAGILAYRAALAGVLVLEKALVAARAIGLALSGPKGWAVLAAGMLVAGGALRTLQVRYQEAAHAARDAADAANEHAAAAKGQAVGDPTADPAKVLAGVKFAAERLEQLRFIRNAQPALGEGLAQKEVFTDLDALMDFEQGLSASETAANLLRNALHLVSLSAEDLGQARADKLRESLVGEIGRVTGVADAIKKARTELALLNGTTDETNLALGEFQAAGALPEQLEELRRVMEEVQVAKAAKGVATEMAAVNQEIFALKNNLTEADKKAQEMLMAGADPAMVDQFKALNTELDKLKAAKAIKDGLLTPAQKLAEELKRLQGLAAEGFLTAEELAMAEANARKGAGSGASADVSTAALERGSSGALSAIARATNQAAGKTEEQQLAENKKTNKTLAKIEKHLSKPGVTIEVGGLA